MITQLTLVVQAGGQSSRMGEDKALKRFLGQPLIARVVERLAPIADEILITTNQPDKYTFLGLPLVSDLALGCGPLGGLYTGLSAASYPVVAVVACDMPFASASLFAAEAALLIQENLDVVIPRTAFGLEPMHAVYRRDACLPFLRESIETGRLKVTTWLKEVNVRELPEAEIHACDPTGLALWNVNTPEEFDGAVRVARAASY